MTNVTVIAIYQPKKDKDEALRALIARHVPTLQRLGFATDRRTTLAYSAPSRAYIEVFEWVSEGKSREAHVHPEVQAIWGPMAEVANFLPMAELQESTAMFAHFEPVRELVC
jgi:hypothetical protein